MSDEAAAAAPGTPPAVSKPEEPSTDAPEAAAVVAQNGGGPPSRVRLGEKQLEAASKEELVGNWKEQDAYIDLIETQSATHEVDLSNLRETLERTRQQHAESQHREKVLVRRLASKEQEMQDYASQLAELRAAQVPSAAALRSALLDPAASLLVQKLRQELAATKTRLEETQNELSAWKFTPDSNTGKRLMAKCRLLYQENEELGRVIASGRLAKLEGELALQKSFSDEVKKSQSELDEFLQELDEDVEGMQGTIYFLQQQLKAAKEAIATLTQENNALKQSGGAPQQTEEAEGEREEEEKGEELEENRGVEEEAVESWAGGEEEEEEEVTQDSAAEMTEEQSETIEQPAETVESAEAESDQTGDESTAAPTTSEQPPSPPVQTEDEESSSMELDEPPSKRTRRSLALMEAEES